MKKYFYQLQFDDFQCGWKDILEEARRDYPEGKIIVDDYGHRKDETIFDPVGCYNKLKEEYTRCSIRFKEILDKGFNVHDIKELLKLELMMYYLVCDYAMDDDYLDYTCFDPADIPALDTMLKDEFFSSYYYYSDYDKYKIFK